MGVSVPSIRLIAKKYENLKEDQYSELIKSPWHEERLLGLIILVTNYERAKKTNPTGATKLYRLYLRHLKYVNNWDLVDLTTPKIVGVELLDKDRQILIKYSQSKNIWERRMAIIATFTFIRNNDFEETLRLARVLLNDPEDLIHKAVGWMLREVGKRNKEILDFFLADFFQQMPRTMLRYAIEKYPEDERKKILNGQFGKNK